MTKRVSARDARAHFAEVTDEVRYTGEPVIVEKQGRPFVVMISIDDLEGLEQMKRVQEAARKSAESTSKGSRDYYKEPEPEDEEIVRAVKKTREELYREWYGRE